MKIEKREVSTLHQFYSLMHETHTLRCPLVQKCLTGSSIDKESVESLKNALESLKNIPSDETGSIVKLDEEKKIGIDIGYETNELAKDILFLSEGEEAFNIYLSELHVNLSAQVEQGVELLENINLRNFVTDRDGTTNNYCGRYLSSIQSVYNAAFLSRFALKGVKNAVMLTSAPLENGGLVDISTIEPGLYVNAGSKGREYRNKKNERGTYEIDPNEQELVDEINRKVSELLKEPRYEKFGLIGSALQLKFGQTTIARQDISKSVPDDESLAFKKTIETIVAEIDPGNKHFRIEDTGLDLEIILTVESSDSSNNVSDFDKGNGIGFLNERLNLGLTEGPNLICGDTNSDVPMLEESLRLCGDKTYTIFVTKKEELKKRVTSLTGNSLIVDEPDILVAILNKLALKQN